MLGREENKSYLVANVVNTVISIYLNAFYTHSINIAKLFNHVNYELILHTLPK